MEKIYLVVKNKELVSQRALYHNPKVLILDESTSSLDSNTENNILNTVTKLKKEITTIIISHNENVLKDTDYIFKIQKMGQLFKINYE